MKKIHKMLRYCNIFFRIRMYFVKKRSINGLKNFMDGYSKYYSAVKLTPEIQKLKEDNISRLLWEKYELEHSIDNYVFKYTHSINID